MKMIVGLGNPGRKYETTRHNVGFIVVDEIAKQLNITNYQNKFNAHIATAEYKGEKILLVKPQTYMNLSGEAVLNLAQYYKIDTQDVLVINDDMDLPVGTIRIRSFGGAAGQKGLKNIIDLLKTNKVPRIRIGIDKNPQIEAADYVLGKFEKETIPFVKDTIIRAKEAALMIVSVDVETAMNAYNMKINGNNTTTD